MWFLIEITWGATHGVLLAIHLRKDANLQTELTAFYRDRGLDEPVKPETLSMADKEALQGIVARHVDVQRIGGFWPTAFTSGLVFGILGFATGIFSRSWVYVGILPLAS